MKMNLHRWLGAAALMALTMATHAAVNVTSMVRGANDATKVTWVSVLIGNPMSTEANCRLEFTGYSGRGGSNVASVDLAAIPPGGSRMVNVPVPFTNVSYGRLIERGVGDQHLGLNSGYRNPMGVVHVAPMSNQLNEAQLDAFTLRIRPDAGPHYSSTGTTITLSPSDRIVTQMRPEEMPENWLCFVPLYYVVISDPAMRQLTAPQRSALETWVNQGGRVVVYGAESARTDEMGAGEIAYVAQNPIEGGSRIEQLQGQQPFAMSTGASGGMPYVERRAGGRNGAFALATLFLIVAGPVNYFYYQKRGQIRKLIVTLPLISLAFCSLIAVYFVMTQGFQRKGGSMSVTLVDEATDRSTTYARHSLLSGLYPLGGFHFNPQTYMQVSGGSDEERSPAKFDLTREQTLTDGVFQPGIPFNYSTVTPFMTRERMIFDAAKGSVRNGFEMPVKAIVVREGDRYLAGGAVPSGGQVVLKPVDAAELVEEGTSYDDRTKETRQLVDLVSRSILQTSEMDLLKELSVNVDQQLELTSGTVYAALVEGVPKTSDSGLKITDGKNLHLILGKMAEQGEAE